MINQIAHNLHIRHPWSNLQKEIESLTNLPLVVPPKLTNPHPLIISTKLILQSEKGKSYRYEGMVDGTRENGLDIRTTPALVGRALRFMDTLIKLFYTRGHSINIERFRGTNVIITNESIKIACREKTKISATKPGQWPTREYHPTGVLVFKTEGYYSQEWYDGKQKIEEQLSKILAILEFKVSRWVTEKEESRKRMEELRVQQQLEEERLQRINKELKSFKRLIKTSKRWNQVRILRDYLHDAEQAATASGNNSPEFNEWLIWARKKLEWYDPAIEAEDIVLEGVDRDKLDL